MPYLSDRFTKQEMTDFVVQSIIEGANAKNGGQLDWHDFGIRAVADPLAQAVGRVSGEQRCVYDVYATDAATSNKLFRCYLKPDRNSYISTMKEDIITRNNPDPDSKIYHLEVRMDSRIFPSINGPAQGACPVFAEPSTNDPYALLQENGAALLQENGAVLLP